jgi:DNA-directed RNA polymerase subunit N (RpoN/RPB10)
MEPVRCITCNAVLHFHSYEHACAARGTAHTALDTMNVRRFCCRRMYMSHPLELEGMIRSFPRRDMSQNDYEVRFSCEVERVVPTA